MWVQEKYDHSLVEISILVLISCEDSYPYTLLVLMIKIRKTHNSAYKKNLYIYRKKKKLCRLRFRETQTPKLRYKCNSISNCKISSYEKKKENKKEKQKIYCLLCVRNVQVFFCTRIPTFIYFIFLFFI